MLGELGWSRVGEGRDAVLNKMVRVGIIEKMRSEKD